MTAQEITTKRGRGRPRKLEPVTYTNIRFETDLYDWLKANKGRKSINQFVNDIIRKEAQL